MEDYKKTEHFEAIAMKCKQEQFEEIRAILSKFGCTEVSMYGYNICNILHNFWNAKQNNLGISEKSHSRVRKSKYYKTWNSETFLKACGIEKVMETPSIEQVKKHFENAKEVRCLWDNEIYDISSWNIYYNKQDTSFFGAKKEKDYMKGTDNYIGLFGKCNYAKYAEIISYKEKTYTLSETFVKELCKEPNIKEAFIREGVVEVIVEIPLKDILATPNSYELGEMVRKLANEKL